MSDLSPAAQAVMHSLWGADLDNCQSMDDIRRRQAAAALRAAAAQLTSAKAADTLRAIAAELEGQ